MPETPAAEVAVPAAAAGQHQLQPDNTSSSHTSAKASRRQYYNKFVVACTLMASLNSILLGYDIGVMSGALLFIKDDFKLSSVQQEVLVGILNLVSLLGGLIAGRLADALGRRRTMATAAAIFIGGALLMALAPSYTILMVGRVVSGIGVGFGMIIAPVYTAELSPSGSRGSLVSLAEVFINTGILVGYIANFALSPLPRSLGWRLMLGLGAAPALVLAAAVFVMPESPRWLTMRGRIEEARAVLIRTSAGNKVEAEEKLALILESLGEEEGYKAKVKVWRQLLWPSVPVRRMLIVSLGIHFLQQASGVDALVYYSPTVFKQAGIKSRTSILGMTIAVGLTKTLFILVATFWLDTLGRRPLLLASSSGMAIALTTVATTFRFLHVTAKGEAASNGHVSIAAVVVAMLAICGFMASFSIGFGPTVYVLTSEIFPLQLRARAMSLSIAVNRGTSGTVALTFLSMARALTTSGAFYLFAGIAVASVVFIYFMVPETKGKSLEQVCEHFGWKLPVSGKPVPPPIATRKDDEKTISSV